MNILVDGKEWEDVGVEPYTGNLVIRPKVEKQETKMLYLDFSAGWFNDQIKLELTKSQASAVAEAVKALIEAVTTNKYDWRDLESVVSKAREELSK